MARKVLREISLLRQLTAIPQNIFTVKLKDIIIPFVTKKAFVQVENLWPQYEVKNQTKFEGTTMASKPH